jgi:nucleoside-diphosphate-sugar epimerase
VDVRDVSDAAIALMNSKVKSGQFLIAAESMAYKDFLSTIAEQLHTSSPSVAVSPWVINLAWRVAMLYSWISGKHVALSREPAEATYSRTSYSGSKLKEWRGKDYISSGEMISDCCRQFLNESRQG